MINDEPNYGLPPERYKGKERIAVGGIGEVIHAIMIDELSGEDMEVAVKRPIGGDPTELFSEEVERTQILLNFQGEVPNLIRVYACDVPQSLIVMELVEQPFSAGTSIESYLASLELEQSFGILRQYFEAMRQLYLVYEFHGDIKKANFLLGKYTDDVGKEILRIKLIDFSFANASKLAIGTPGYISLRDIESNQPSDANKVVELYRRRDAFGFYATIFELLYGHKPFKVPNKWEVTGLRPDLYYMLELAKKNINLEIMSDSIMAKFGQAKQAMIGEYFKRLLLDHDQNQIDHESWLQDFEQELFSLLENRYTANTPEKPAQEPGFFRRVFGRVGRQG